MADSLGEIIKRAAAAKVTGSEDRQGSAARLPTEPPKGEGPHRLLDKANPKSASAISKIFGGK